ncbi:hypothetical protein C8035_v002200 [Colletotrichum spinosum]|uniref:Uncharacterized protein n=1 Tax=Colletotrichum spinosum TaxID=1347390 RepID=A0A4R8QLF6_9PEZI|nr:hypothetical protein C8035_v002200 [Colletotrichum spinosum]
MFSNVQEPKLSEATDRRSCPSVAVFKGGGFLENGCLHGWRYDMIWGSSSLYSVGRLRYRRITRAPSNQIFADSVSTIETPEGASCMSATTSHW